MPPSPIETTEVCDYLEEVIIGVSSPHHLAAEARQHAQQKYQNYYDQLSKHP